MRCLNHIKAFFATSSSPSQQTQVEKNTTQVPPAEQSNTKPSVNSTISSATMSSTSLPKTYKQASFKELGGDLVLEEVPLRLPAAGEILVKVEACGVCHSDVFAKYNAWGAGYPMVPGHEIIGKVAALGDGVSGWTVGDRIGGAWHGGHDGTCAHCQNGLYQFCEPYVVTGVTKNGGYAEYCLVQSKAAVKIPEGVNAIEFAPVLCAGSTVFTAIKSANVTPGGTVAVQGLGGLGHMAVQFARKMGYRVVAVSRGRDKEASVRKLGAHEYIDATEGDAGEALKALGGADLVLTTAMDTAAMVPLIKGVGIYGKMLILSFPPNGEITLNAHDMMMRGVSVQVWPTCTAHECEKTVDFAHLNGLNSAVQSWPLDKVQEAFDAMMNGNVRYRAVITM